MNGDNTVLQTLDTTLLAYGVTEQEERTRVATEINQKSEALMEALITFEESLSLEEKGAMFGQTDLIGNHRNVLKFGVNAVMLKHLTAMFDQLSKLFFDLLSTIITLLVFFMKSANLIRNSNRRKQRHKSAVLSAVQ